MELKSWNVHHNCKTIIYKLEETFKNKIDHFYAWLYKLNILLKNNIVWIFEILYIKSRKFKSILGT